MAKQKRRLTRVEKRKNYLTVKAWLTAKEKARKLKEAEKLGKLTADYRVFRKNPRRLLDKGF